jgi:hypothetical protein
MNSSRRRGRRLTSIVSSSSCDLPEITRSVAVGAPFRMPVLLLLAIIVPRFGAVYSGLRIAWQVPTKRAGIPAEKKWNQNTRFVVLTSRNSSINLPMNHTGVRVPTTR